jgi:hypothetical protein
MNRTRPALLAIALLTILLILAYALPRLLDPGVLTVDDFVEYWSAGRLNALGGDPYSPDQLFPLQQAAGLTQTEPIMMWNPPWTLTFVMPFGLADYPPARLAWLMFHLALVLFCADRLWQMSGGPLQLRWLAWAVALSFCPTLIVLRMGQIAPLMLLGLTGFLHFQKMGREGLAGACLFLTAIKPHLVYLVWLAWLAWVVSERRWKSLAGTILTGLVLTLIPLAVNPNVLEQYRYQTLHQPPVDWQTTTFGSLLRVCFGEEKRWLPFVPTAIGLAWLVPYWLRARRAWRWDESLPLLLLVSYCTASFGWLGDQVVLLLALLPIAAGLARRPCQPTIILAVVVYVTLDAADLGINVFFYDKQLWHLWTAPALLVGFVVYRHGESGAATKNLAPEKVRELEHHP